MIPLAISPAQLRTGSTAGLTAAILLIAVFVLLVPGSSLAVEPVANSNSFQALLNEAEKMYIVPRGGNLEHWERQRSRDLATVVGHALRQQQGYVETNPSLQDAHDNLVREARDYIDRIAALTGANPQTLAYAMDRAMRGADDQLVFKQYRVRFGSMPSVLSASAPMPEPSARLPLKQEKPGEQIDLLNTKRSETPDAAKATYNMGVDYWNAGSKAWNGGDQETAHTRYQMAANYWAKACDMGWVDGCRGAQGLEYGQFLRYWGQ